MHRDSISWIGVACAASSPARAADSAAERRSTTTRPSSPELAIDAGKQFPAGAVVEETSYAEAFSRSLCVDLAAVLVGNCEFVLSRREEGDGSEAEGRTEKWGD
jgi:hypothetical protein